MEWEATLTSLREAGVLPLATRFKAQVLAEMGDVVCTVDLYTNPTNNTKALFCAPLNSCDAYDWSRLGLCWAIPPWSHIVKMLTKAVLDRAKVVVLTPDWGQTGEAAKWCPLVDRLTKIRIPLLDVPLYVSDGARTPLPPPRWGSIASYIDDSDGSKPLSHWTHIFASGYTE